MAVRAAAGSECDQQRERQPARAHRVGATAPDGGQRVEAGDHPEKPTTRAAMPGALPRHSPGTPPLALEPLPFNRSVVGYLQTPMSLYFGFTAVQTFPPVHSEASSQTTSSPAPHEAEQRVPENLLR